MVDNKNQHLVKFEFDIICKLGFNLLVEYYSEDIICDQFDMFLKKLTSCKKVIKNKKNDITYYLINEYKLNILSPSEKKRY